MDSWAGCAACNCYLEIKTLIAVKYKKPSGLFFLNMKALKPSHREHKRYLLLSGADANPREIEAAVLKFIGVLGYAKAGCQIVKQTAKRIILSVDRKEVDKVRASFLLSGKNIKIEKISGTIAKLG